jgi:hypothetical protein
VTVHLEPVGDLRLKENEGPARLKIHAPKLLADDSVKVAYFVVPREPGLETATLGADFTLGQPLFESEELGWHGIVELQGSAPRYITLPFIDDNVLEFDEQFEIGLQIVQPAHFAPTTSLAIESVVVTIENDDLERPPGSVLFYNFDGLYSISTGEYLSTSDPAYVEDGLLAGPLSHSAGPLLLGAGLPKLDPHGLPDPETPAAAANRWRAVAHRSDNLVTNGGNEQGRLRGWKMLDQPWRDRPFGAVEAFEGRNYFAGGKVLDSKTKGTTRIFQDVDVSNYAAAIDAGVQQFEFSAWLRAAARSGDQGQVQLQYLGPRGRVLGQFTSEAVTSTTAWQLVENREIVPSGTRQIRIMLIGQNANQSTGSVDVYFDAIELRAALPQYYSMSLKLDDDSDLPFLSPEDFQNAQAVTLSGIDFWDRTATGGPVLWELRSSVDDFQTSIASGATHGGEFGHHVRIPLDSHDALRPIDEPLELRLYGYASQDGPWHVDNLAVLGRLQSLSEFPHPPIAADDSVTVLSTQSIDISVLLNDFDPNGDELTIIGYTQGQHGAVALVGDGSLLRYTPSEASGSDSDSFTYTITDGNGGYDTATISVEILTPPAPVDDSYNVLQGMSLSGDVAANDLFGSFPDAMVVLISSAKFADELTLHDDGSFDYTPLEGFTGVDSFKYALDYGKLSLAATVTIAVQNDPDRAADPDDYTVDEDQVLNVGAPGVLDNDDPGQGASLSAVLVTGPTNGHLALNADGSFRYTPNANYNGTDSFVYKIGDADNDPQATVTITVNPVNDRPIAHSLTEIIPRGHKEEIIVTPSGGDVETDRDDLKPQLHGHMFVFSDGGNPYIHLDGTIRYQPDPVNGFQENFSFSYWLRDTGDPPGDASTNDLLSDPATVNLMVMKVIASDDEDDDEDDDQDEDVEVDVDFGLVGGETEPGGRTIQGYLEGSTVFLDVNGNLTPDRVTLPHPETGELVEFDEPTARTTADGRFFLAVPSLLDTNGNGRLDPDEGTLVVEGGLIASSGLTLPTQMKAPGGASIVTPLTTLLWTMAEEFDLSYDNAQLSLRTALNLPGVDLLHFHALDEVHGGNPLAPTVYRAGVGVQNLVVQAGTALSASSELSTQQAADAVLAELAERALFGQRIDLSDTELVRNIVGRVAQRRQAALDDAALDAVAQIIAASNSALQAAAPSADLGFLDQLARIQQVAQSASVDDLVDLATGALPPADALARNTGDALAQRIAEATPGNLQPVRLFVADQTVRFDDGAPAVEFLVRLDQPSLAPVRVEYSTADGSAVAGQDYDPVSGVLEFAPGQLVQAVEVPVYFDPAKGVTRFDLLLDQAQGAIFLDSVATAFIVSGDDEDNIPAILEAAAPNDGDGNFDGIPDAIQSHVASLRNALDGRFITVEAPSGTVLTGVETGFDAATAEFDQVEFPQGHVQFTVSPAGTQTTVTLYFEQPLDINSYYQFGPRPTPRSRTGILLCLTARRGPS